jgi:hypothetical protein
VCVCVCVFLSLFAVTVRIFFFCLSVGLGRVGFAVCLSVCHGTHALFPSLGIILLRSLHVSSFTMAYSESPNMSAAFWLPDESACGRLAPHFSSGTSENRKHKPATASHQQQPPASRTPRYLSRTLVWNAVATRALSGTDSPSFSQVLLLQLSFFPVYLYSV